MQRIEIREVSKSFDIYPSPMDRLKDLLWLQSKKSTFQALKNISLRVRDGEAFAIIGQNGSGKSTLLQIIAGVQTASQGSVTVNGRVAALLELGAGFNPEFTGRDNVLLNGALMGIGRSEMEARLPLIESFAEIGDFIDNPVKTYSSGMYVRLAFASAINVDPDVLIVDEALAVGDAYFQLKCISKIKEFRKKGKTILYVTHDTQSVKNICDRAIWINDGIDMAMGGATEVVDLYEDFMRKKSAVSVASISEEVNKQPGVPVKNNFTPTKAGEILSVTMDNERLHKGELRKCSYLEKLCFAIEFETYINLPGLVAGLAIFDSEENYVCGLNTKLDGINIEGRCGIHKIDLVFPNIRLCPGTYSLDVGLFEDNAVVNIDYWKRFSSLLVIHEAYLGEGTVILEHLWRVDEQYGQI